MAFCILEGADGGGKTTFANAIAAQFKSVSDPRRQVKLVHCGPPKKNALDEYALDVENYKPGASLDIVADRWHLGALVYGPLYRDTGPYGELGLAGFRWVEMFLAARGAVAWLVDQDYELVRERLAARGEDYLQDRHVEWALERFREVAKESMLVIGTVSPPEGDQTHLAQQYRDAAYAVEQIAAPLAEFPGYIGTPRPYALLVGDKRGDGPDRERTRAPFMPVPSGSGTYLLNALPSPLWKSVGVLNANENDIPGFINRLGYTPRIVALGREASNTLLDHDIEHAGVPHPQHARRFAAKKRTEYGQLIWEAVETGRVAFSWPR